MTFFAHGGPSVTNRRYVQYDSDVVHTSFMAKQQFSKYHAMNYIMLHRCQVIIQLFSLFSLQFATKTVRAPLLKRCHHRVRFTCQLLFQPTFGRVELLSSGVSLVMNFNPLFGCAGLRFY